MANETTGRMSEADRAKIPQMSRLAIVTLALAASERGDSGGGLCLGCGELVESCEPDARNYECSACKRPLVFGLDEVITRYCL